MLRKTFLWLVVFLPLFSFSTTGFKIDERTVIVASDIHLPVINLASAELQYFIYKTTGIAVPVISEKPNNSQKPIYVGQNKYGGNSTLKKEKLNPQEYIIDISEDRIVLIGYDNPDTGNSDTGRDNNGISASADRKTFNYGQVTGDDFNNSDITLPSIYDSQGTCYAVYDFIESYLGVRFYGPHPDNVYIPEKSSISLKPSYMKRSLAIAYRHGTYTLDWPIMKDQFLDADAGMQELFLRRLRFGGKKYAANHSFTSYQDRFLKKNPERPELFEEYRPQYFAKGRTGGPHERQFCYTNPDLVKQVAKDAQEYFDSNKLFGEQVAWGDYFAVVPLDNANWCLCEECQRLISKDKDNILGEHFNCGTATHYIWSFINNVAKEIKKTNGNKKIAALAYHVYAYLPEDIVIEDNIAVAPCLHPRNYWAPQMKKNEVAFYKEWVKEAQNSGREIYLWNYLCFPTERGLIGKFNVFPGFNVHELSSQIKMYASDKVKGIFMCGIGEQLDFYAVMKMYDNPELNIDELIDDFFTSYFPASGKYMKQFYSKIESVYADPSNYPDYIRNKDAQYHQTEELAWKYLGTPEVMRELSDYIEKAEKSAGSELESRRVASWKKGVWQYMLDGYNKYTNK